MTVSASSTTAAATTGQPTSTGPAALPGRAAGADSGAFGVWAAAALVLAAVAASLVGLGRLVPLLYAAAAVAIALRLLWRSSWYSYLAFTLAMWLCSHEVRRIVDWQTSYHSFSVFTVTGALVSLTALPWALAGRRRAYRDGRNLVVVALVVVAYGVLVGAVRNGPLPTAADFLTLGGPLTTGLFVMAVPEDDDRLRRLLQATVLWGTLLLSAYAVVQFLVLPAWDLAWFKNSGVTTLGKPTPGHFRAFGTLSSAGPLGQVLAAFLVVLAAERRTRWQLPAALIGLMALGITLVRAGWIGFAVGLLVLALLGRRRVGRLLALVVLLLLALVAVRGPITAAVTQRASATAAAGTSDTSFVSRLRFQAQIAPQALSNPVGDGLGATGLATDLAPVASSDPFRNFDSGIFENLTRYGALAGGALLIALLSAVAGIVRRARSGTLLDAACAAAVVGLVVGLIFTDTLKANYGLVLWLLIGVQSRDPAPGRS